MFCLFSIDGWVKRTLHETRDTLRAATRPPLLTGGVRAGPRPATVATLGVGKLGMALARCHALARGSTHDTIRSSLLLVRPECSPILCPHFQKHRPSRVGALTTRQKTEYKQ